HKPLSFSGLRAASATDNSDCASSRASDALRPSPAPTIRDVLYAGVIQALPDDVVLRDNDVAAYQWTPSLLLRSVPANAQLESANLHASSSVSVAPSAMSASRSLRSSRSSKMCSRRKRALASFA